MKKQKSSSPPDDDREFAKSELAKYQRSWPKKKVLIVDALWTCNLFGVPPPEWIVWAVQGLIEKHKPYTTRRQYLIDFERWKRVNNFGTKWMKPMKGRKPLSLEKIYDIVAEQLIDDFAEGEREAVKKSYLRVETAMKRGEADHYLRSDFDAKKLSKIKRRRGKVG